MTLQDELEAADANLVRVSKEYMRAYRGYLDSLIDSSSSDSRRFDMKLDWNKLLVARAEAEESQAKAFSAVLADAGIQECLGDGWI